MPHKVFIHAFGCQMNKLDAELALSALRRAGYEEAATPDEADVVLYNTCSVRAHAEERVYSNVGKLKSLKRRKPRLIIGILGCMAQKDGEKIFERLPHVDLVCGTREFPRIAELIEEARRADRVLACSEAAAVSEAREISVRPDRRRAFLGIMRGCDNYCAYCVVPYVRGPEISRPITEVVDEAHRLADDGCREITLLGQNVNSYGKSFDPPAHALADLLARLDRIAGLARVRFVTSHPKDMSREILEAVRDLPAVCEHLHMPAQSGSDRVLAAMNRSYTARGYRDLVALARELVPGIAIASDFIVGFPGETEAEFDETAALVRDLRFQNSFVFKYSTRPGTAAAKLADDVPWEEKRRRNLALLEIQSAVQLEENRKFIGQEVEVLVEGRSHRDASRLTGRLRTNQIVVFEGPEALAGELVRVRVESATPLTLAGSQAPAGDLRPTIGG
ncbi:MAG: tRNA (N6-isopentenyl adenosine(37)-C2)-methylthiotransferase MiaB [Candidatus Brocadiia bacterium]